MQTKIKNYDSEIWRLSDLDSQLRYCNKYFGGTVINISFCITNTNSSFQ